MSKDLYRGHRRLKRRGPVPLVTSVGLDGTVRVGKDVIQDVRTGESFPAVPIRYCGRLARVGRSVYIRQYRSNKAGCAFTEDGKTVASRLEYVQVVRTRS